MSYLKKLYWSNRESSIEKKMAGNEGMENLITLVNRLQDVATRSGVAMDMDLPQIAVVGGQSAGKSSVLENFVGRDFLPRGSGIVTRRPLVLQLVNNGSRKEEYAEFLHCPNEKFTDFDEVRREIEEETDRVIGGKGISNIPINLRVFSPKVLNLTLVDLPGLTKVAIGNQPLDIEARIRNMILEFISKESCLILAVTPANTDLANSDALKLAKEVDPKGTRTIGVITKLDLMDEGTNARDILENRLLPLRRGYVGVVNRSQKAINDNKEIVAAIDEEKQFFQCHGDYKHMAEKLGTPYLQKILNQQLSSHIRETLPALRKKLLDQMKAFEKDMKREDMNLDESAVKTKTMILLMNQLEAVFINAIGCYESDNIGKSLNNGSKIHYLMHEHFPQEIEKIKLSDDDLCQQIKLAILNIRGVRSGMFTPDMAFEAVAKEQIAHLKEPAMNCISQVVSELQELLDDCTQLMDKYPKLREMVDEKLMLHVRECEEKCQEQLSALLEYELSYINTKHIDFVGLKGVKSQLAYYQKGDKEREDNMNDDDNQKVFDITNILIEDIKNNGIIDREVEIFEILVNSYMTIVTKTVQDLVPKTVMCLIIKKIKNFIKLELLSQLLAEEDIFTLMELCKDEKNKRDDLVRMYHATKDALKIVREVSSSISKNGV
ncbi:dynamin-1-like [Aphidius gifuensis]|uniref:dynamin-1-like n=1 Tax=Aphidius gifuensis TaxID=684658 RepID=UPI001CDD48BB|nr:dynamin-1-like [Aphidius gifuensis]